MKIKELIKILQKHDPDKKIMFLSDDGIYTFDLNYLDRISMELSNVIVIHIKKEVYE